MDDLMQLDVWDENYSPSNGLVEDLLADYSLPDVTNILMRGETE